MIFYTNRFVPETSAACTRGPLIFIRPEYKNDIGLLEHEKTHVRQWYRTCGFHSIIYPLSQLYRLKAELEAYKCQLNYSPNNVDLFAEYISTDYGINITKSEAKKLLLG